MTAQPGGGTRATTLLLAPGPQPVALLPARATVRVFSAGWGVQSVAVLALQAMGKLPNPYDYFVFANVGDDSENPATLVYIKDLVIPFAAKHGINLVEVQKMRGRGKNKTPDTLLSAINREDRSVPIPAYMSQSGAPGNRSCTQDYKIKVIDDWIKAQGFTRAIIGLGISIDELRRVKSTEWHDRYFATRPFGFWKRREYPLVTLRLARVSCYAAIEAAGLPIPPDSACWFCPFRKLHYFAETSRTEPAQFQRIVDVENRVNDKRSLLGKDHLFLSSTLLPIQQAVATYKSPEASGQLSLWPEKVADACDEGVCMI